MFVSQQSGSFLHVGDQLLSLSYTHAHYFVLLLDVLVVLIRRLLLYVHFFNFPVLK